MVRTRAGATTTAPAPATALLSMSSTTTIPLRPELVALIGVQGVGRLACCSAALRGELRDAKAWEQLANAREPRSKREMAISAERDAAARVRAYDLRRRLADVASGKVEPQAIRPNKFADFTYFVRFEEDGEVIWEGDLKGSLDERRGRNIFSLPLAEAWSAASDSWDGMVEFLEAPAGSNFTTGGGATSYLARLRITVIAMRDEDQAMVSLGHFELDNHLCAGIGEQKMYMFKTRIPVMFLRDFILTPMLWLCVTHDEQGGTLNSLEVGLYQIPRPPRGRQYQRAPYMSMPCASDQVEFLLTFLAGIHHPHHNAHQEAMEEFESWHDIAARKFEAIRQETRAAMQRME